MKIMLIDLNLHQCIINIFDTEKEIAYMKILESKTHIESLNFALAKAREYQVDTIMIDTSGVGVYAKDFFEKNTNKNDLWMDNIINLRYREM